MSFQIWYSLVHWTLRTGGGTGGLKWQCIVNCIVNCHIFISVHVWLSVILLTVYFQSFISAEYLWTAGTRQAQNDKRFTATFIFDHPCSGMVYNFGHVCVSVCLYVCQTITFESLDVGSSYLHVRYVSTVYGSSSYMKVIWPRSKSQEPKKSKIRIPAM